jgi:hypothetical protein
VETQTTLTRREATLRSAATTSLAGIALVQAIELPFLFAQGGQLAVLAITAMAACIALGLTLAAAPAGAARQVWGLLAAGAVVVLAGWAASHALAIPGQVSDRGNWASMPGLASAVLAVLCIGFAIAAVRPTRAAVRGLATSLAVALALVPAAAAVVVGLGPGTVGGETVLASGGHLHSHGSPENAIVYQPLPGGKGGRYVYKAKPVPHQTAIGIAMMVTASFIFTYGAVGYLRRRTVSVERLALGQVEGGLA